MLVDIFTVADEPSTQQLTVKKNTPDQAITTKTVIPLTYKTGNKLNIINSEAWGKIGERAAQLKKGDVIYAIGPLIRREWKDANNYNRHDFYLSIDEMRIIKQSEQTTERIVEQVGKSNELELEFLKYQNSDDCPEILK